MDDWWKPYEKYISVDTQGVLTFNTPHIPDIVDEFDVIYPFDPDDQSLDRPLFSKTYKVQSIILPNRFRETRTMILKCVSNSKKEVAVKCLFTGIAEMITEYNTLKKVAQMRKQRNLECIVDLFGYCEVDDDPFKTYSNFTDNKTRLSKELIDTEGWSYLYVIMEYVPFRYDQLESITLEMIVAFLVDLLYTLWQARQGFQFYHGDISTGNIMFRPTAIDTRTYIMEETVFTINAPYVPVFIDFEKSEFGKQALTDFEKREYGEKGKPERLSDVRSLVVTLAEIYNHYHKQNPLPRDLAELRDFVLSDPFTKLDSRFTPETIVAILREYRLFANVRGKE